MIDGIDGARSGYRDQLANVFQNSEKTDSTESAEKPSQKWDAVFTDKKENSVSVNDFLNLMVAQLRNQDFMNPVDDTQYVTQLAQFATMQQMQEMATYMKTNYVMSLVGKNVTAAKLSVSGELHKETGAVEKISLVNNEYAVYVNGKRFTLEQIMEKYGLQPQEMVMIDDLKPGYDMARSVGVPFIGAGWANDIAKIRTFMKQNSDYYFTNVKELEKFLFS